MVTSKQEAPHGAKGAQPSLMTVQKDTLERWGPECTPEGGGKQVLWRRTASGVVAGGLSDNFTNLP